MLHAIRFDNDQEEVRGVEIAADYGLVHCKPNGIFLISEAQLEILQDFGVQFFHLCQHDSKSKSKSTSSDLAPQATNY